MVSQERLYRCVHEARRTRKVLLICRHGYNSGSFVQLAIEVYLLADYFVSEIHSINTGAWRWSRNR